MRSISYKIKSKHKEDRIIKGKKNGNRVQKTIRICNCCGAWMSSEDIKEKVIENFGWD